METLYYRKIAEIMLRDEAEPTLREAAERVTAAPRKGKVRIAKTDRRLLRDWMRAWCDRAEALWRENEQTQLYGELRPPYQKRISDPSTTKQERPTDDGRNEFSGLHRERARAAER